MEDIIEKIKEYKLFLALTAIGLLLEGIFFSIDLRGVHQQYRISIRLPIQLRAKKRHLLLVPEKKSRLLQCLMRPRSLRSMSKGAVKQPGVYELRSDSRVHDAIHKAGGMTAEANSQSVNLAQKLSDEAVIYVAKEGEDVPALGSSESPTTSSASAEKQARSI